MAATLSGVCAATSTPAEKQFPSPRITTTEISDLDSTSARAAESSSIIGISMMLSGGFRNMTRPTQPSRLSASLANFEAVWVAILRIRHSDLYVPHELSWSKSLVCRSRESPSIHQPMDAEFAAHFLPISNSTRYLRSRLQSRYPDALNPRTPLRCHRNAKPLSS